MRVREIAAGDYFGVMGRGTALPEIFSTNNSIFHISPKFEVIGLQKFGGSVHPP